MARRFRVELSGVVHHIILRAVDLATRLRDFAVNRHE
jgi:hypothetical protein